MTIIFNILNYPNLTNQIKLLIIFGPYFLCSPLHDSLQKHEGEKLLLAIDISFNFVLQLNKIFRITVKISLGSLSTIKCGKQMKTSPNELSRLLVLTC